MIRPRLFASLSIALVGIAGIAVVAACSEDRTSFEPEPTPPPNLGGDSSVTPPDASACLSQTLGAVPVPLAMLLVMDRSGSMNSPSGNTKWDQARRAMIGFADTKGAAGSKLGLTLFPPDTTAQDDCDVGSYAPIVPIDLLPDNGVSIKDALLSRDTTGSTPMGPALAGGMNAMKSYLAENANEEGVVILVTDGVPGGCTGDSVSNVASIASAHAKGKPRIRTFVVGMDGATFSSLDTIAAAGEGAPKAFNASGGDGGTSPQQQLLDSLEQIRSGALGCEYILPAPKASEGVVDPDSVEIDFTPGVNDPAQRFRRVEDASKCGATTGGFYYDDPDSPKRIILCPASCNAVKAGTNESKIDVVLGCIRQVN